eukprot:g3620.t1
MIHRPPCFSPLSSRLRWLAIRATPADAGVPGPKTGTVGEERFADLKVPGTYWWTETNVDGQKLTVTFDTGEGEIVTILKAHSHFTNEFPGDSC